MTKQPYYDDIKVGDLIPPLVKKPTTRQLVSWADVSGDDNPIHYDPEFAKGQGLPGVIVQGQLTFCFMGQLLTDWIGKQGSLKKLTCSYKGMNLPNEILTCHGRVTKKYIKSGEHCIECNLWLVNQRGEKTLSGTSVVALPAKV